MNGLRTRTGNDAAPHAGDRAVFVATVVISAIVAALMAAGVIA